MSAADLKASELYQAHLLRQQQLMRQFVADSLRLMHEFKTSLDPIHAVLKRLKQPLEQVLLDSARYALCCVLCVAWRVRGFARVHVGRPVRVDSVRRPGFADQEARLVAQGQHVNYYDLGAEIKSLRQAPPQEQEQNTQDTHMAESTEAEESVSAPQCEADVYTQAILGYLSNTATSTSFSRRRCWASSPRCRRSGRGCGRHRRRRSCSSRSRRSESSVWRRL